MEFDPGKIKGIENIKKFLKEIQNGSAMSTFLECGKRTLNVLALLVKNFNAFFFQTLLL